MEEFLTNEDIANFMSKIFNSKIFQHAYSNNIHVNYSDLANILAKYYISTGDSSLESVKDIIADYVENNTDSYSFFQNFLMPRICNKVASTLNMSQDLTLKDKITILEYVDIRNNNNKFYTHCFPGSLYDEVSSNGLDISKELFKEEFKILSECFNTPFKTGELNYCELSASSLSYAIMGVPERLTYAIGGVKSRLKGETLHDTFARSLKENLESKLADGTIDNKMLEELETAGIKIIDFYCTSQSCIAFFRENETSTEYSSNMQSLVVSDFNKFNNEFKNTFLGTIFQNEIALAKENPKEEIEIYENAFNKVIHLYPESKEYIENLIEEIMSDRMSDFAINNYYHGGYGDGYAIEGGKLEPEKFSISKFTSPYEIMAQEQKSNSRRSFATTKDETNNTSSSFKDFKPNLLQFSKKMNLLKASNAVPEEIFMISMPKQFVLIASVDGKKTAIGNYLLESTDKEEVFSSFTGNIDNLIINDMANELEKTSSPQKKEEIIKLYKSTDEYDEDYFDEFEAFNWYSAIQYEKMNEQEKTTKKTDVLNKKKKFIVFEKDGKIVASPLEQGEITEIYESEEIYNQNGTGKYNELFEEILGISRISINSFVANAINNGIGTEEVQKADNVTKVKYKEQEQSKTH